MKKLVIWLLVLGLVVVAALGFTNGDTLVTKIEKVEEAREEMIIIRENMVKFWERVRADDLDNSDIMESIVIHGTELIKEAVQIVACAKKHDWGRLQEWARKVRE